ncbi:hypothetical protein Tco_0959846 [Tanacetum coccineum]
MIVCHKKVVRISLEGDEILQVQSERAQGVAKTLLNTKVDEPKVSDTSVVRDFVDTFQKTCQLPPQQKVEFRIDLVPGATPVSESPYRLAPLEMQEFEELGSVKDKILATSSETPKVENTPAEMLRDMKRGQMMVSTLWIKLYSEYEYEIRYHPGKANVVTDALTQSEAFKQENVPLVGSEMDEAHASRLRLPEELSSVHDTFHVSNLKKKCLADDNLHVPLDEIEADKTLHFVEEPKGIMDREI